METIAIKADDSSRLPVGIPLVNGSIATRFRAVACVEPTVDPTVEPTVEPTTETSPAFRQQPQWDYRRFEGQGRPSTRRQSQSI